MGGPIAARWEAAVRALFWGTLSHLAPVQMGNFTGWKKKKLTNKAKLKQRERRGISSESYGGLLSPLLRSVG